MKFYINPSNQYANMYAYANTNEKVQMERIAYALRDELGKYECEVLVATKNYIRDKATEAKAWGADFAIALHSNAASATASGTRGYYNKYFDVSKRMAQRLCDNIDAINPFDRGASGLVDNYSYQDIYRFGDRGIPSILAEIAFHDNPSEARWIVENTGAIAVAICKCFVDEYNLVIRGATGGSEAPTDVRYRVQVGAFGDKSNADKMAAKLKADGFATYMVKFDGLYKVQTGAFAVKSNADALANTLKAKGYDTYITTQKGEPVGITVDYPKVGDKVKVRQGATTYTGDSLASFVYQGIYDLQELSGTRAVIGIGGRVTAAVDIKDLLRA